MGKVKTDKSGMTEKEKYAEKLLRRLIDLGPLWYRGSMPEEGQAIEIIIKWMADIRQTGRCPVCGLKKKRPWVKGKPGKRNHRKDYLNRKYGLTQAAFEAMLVGQGGVCAACGTQDWGKMGPVIHHNHQTGEVVAILCNSCNCAAGNLGDNPLKMEALANFLTKFHSINNLPA